MQSLLSLPPLPFVENHGQVDSRVAFIGRAGAMAAYYGRGEIAYGLHGYDPDRLSDDDLAALDCASARHSTRARCGDAPKALRWWVTQELVGARTAQPTSLEAAETVISYLVPPLPLPAIPGHHRLVYERAWPGIDIVVDHEGPRALKTTYLLQPGANPDQLRFRWRGASARLSESGALELTTPLGVLREGAPIAWQTRDGELLPVPARFVLQDAVDGPPEVVEAEIGVALDAYDPTLPIVVDPVLEFASYIGGNSFDYATAVTVDSSNRAIVVGNTKSDQNTFPDGDGFSGLPGLDQTLNSDSDGFVARLNAAGTAFEFATYLGGSGDDIPNDVVDDSSGRAIIVGETTSTQETFPDGDGFGGMPGADKLHNGSVDAFVARLNVNGTAVEYATYLGGNADDIAWSVALDPSGRPVFTGETLSQESSFPDGDGFNGIPGADLTLNSPVLADGFVARLSADGSVIEYVSYFGGSDEDYGYSVAVDSSGRAHVTGQTLSGSNTFPDGDGVGEIPGFGSTGATFVIRFSADGTQFDYLNYIAIGVGNAIVIDASGRITIAGVAVPGTMITGGVGADQTANGETDGIVLQLDPTGESILYASFIGGQYSDTAYDVAADSLGRIVVTGETYGVPAGSAAAASVSRANGARGHRTGVPATTRTPASRGIAVHARDGERSHSPRSTGHSSSAGRQPSPPGAPVQGLSARSQPRFTPSSQGTFPDGDGIGSIPSSDPTYNGGAVDVYVVRFTSNGSAFDFVSYLGGSGDELAYGIAVDGADRILAVGSVLSTQSSFPDGDGFGSLTGADPSFNTGVDPSMDDGFVTRFNVSANPPPCGTPRPKVTIATTRPNANQLSVTVSTAASVLTSIQIGSSSSNPANTAPHNAVATFANGASSGTAGFVYTLPANQTQTTFTVTRQAAGRFIFPFIANDTCGPWPSFVGIGS